MSEPERRFAETEARVGFGGILASLPCFWLNHPSRVTDAEYKPLQLRVAAACGLQVPATLITNDPVEAHSFAENVCGRVVYKSLSNSPMTEEGRLASLFTSIVSPQDYGDPGIARTAHLFQEWVPKRHEVRLTAVAGELFAVEIHAQHSERGAIDWRADYASHEYKVTEVPDDVATGVKAMLGELGLGFGALDFVVTPKGQWVFLELNPNGEWGWLEHATGFPIAAAVANALERGETRA